jgi:hypothetical protein
MIVDPTLPRVGTVCAPLEFERKIEGELAASYLVKKWKNQTIEIVFFVRTTSLVGTTWMSVMVLP